MLPHVKHFRWLLFFISYGTFNGLYTEAAWPTKTSSKAQILGAFYNNLTTTELNLRSLQTRAMFLAAIELSHQFNITIGGEQIGWQLIESEENIINTLSKTCLLVSSSNIVGIVGPTLSRESHMIAPLAGKLSIPMISHAATDPDLANRKAYPSFYRTVASDNAAALAVTKLFLKFKWPSCVIIYQNDAFGSGGAKSISETFDKYHLKVTEMLIFDIVTRSIQGDFHRLLTNGSARIIILWVEENYASLVLHEALNHGILGPNFTWILGSNVPFDSFNRSVYSKLLGMFTIEPVVGSMINAPFNTTLLTEAYAIWQKYEPETFPGADNVNYYALFSFDATWSLIRSLEKLCSENTSCISFFETPLCFHRRFLNSDLLFHIIDNTSFLGVSGLVEFGANVTDRISGNYYVVKNVQRSSKGLKYVPVLTWSAPGDWSPHTQRNTILWPGKSLIAPTGYAAATGAVLRIVVIETAPFTVVQEIKNESGKLTRVLVGYVPDLIHQLQKKMDFVANITVLPSNQNYNALIDSVAENVYDMIVGDVTIIADRRQKVGFSGSIFDSASRVIVRNSAVLRTSNLFPLKTSVSVWICILLFTACIVALNIYDKRQRERQKQKSILSRMANRTWYCFALGAGYGVVSSDHCSFGSLLIEGLYITSIVLVAIYSVKLIPSILHSSISGIDDIKSGRIPPNRIGIIAGSSYETYYLRQISGGNRNFFPLHSKEEMYNKLLDGTIDASIMDAVILEYSTEAVYRNLTLVGNAFDHGALGIVHRKKWIYEQVLDVSLSSLRESGALDALKSKWFKTNYPFGSSEKFVKLSTVQILGLSIAFGTMSLLCLSCIRRRIRCWLFKLFEKCLQCLSASGYQTSMYEV